MKIFTPRGLVNFFVVSLPPPPRRRQPNQEGSTKGLTKIGKIGLRWAWASKTKAIFRYIVRGYSFANVKSAFVAILKFSVFFILLVFLVFCFFVIGLKYEINF